MALLLKLRWKVSLPEQVRGIPPQPDPRGVRAAPRFIPGEWYSCQTNPPAPGMYDARCRDTVYDGAGGNIWDGQDWFWSDLDKAMGNNRTYACSKNWQWRMPK